MNKFISGFTAFILILSISLSVSASTVIYKDVKDKDWYKKYVTFVSNNGIMKEAEKGYFKPNDKTSRAELARSIYNYDTYSNKNIDKKIKISNEALLKNINKIVDKKISNSQDDEKKTISTIAKSMPSVVMVGAGNSIGTGFFIGKKQILTNYHVISDPTNLRVKLVTGQIYDAKILKTDSNRDLALLEIDSNEDFIPLEFTDSKTIGQTIIILGNPEGIPFTASKGIVSRTELRDTNGYMDLIQMDAPVNHGNSGSPVIGYDGKVIGIVVSKYEGAEIDSIGFSISYKTIKEFLGN